MSVEKLCRAAFWACVLAILYLSLVPGEARPHTGASGLLEHFVAYVATAFLISPGSTGRTRVVAGLSLAALSGGLEIVQLFIPGRTGEFIGFAVSSLGAATGIAAGALAESLRRGAGRAKKPRS